MMTSGSRIDLVIQMECRRFSRRTQMIARSAIFLSAFPYNVNRIISAKRGPIPL